MQNKSATKLTLALLAATALSACNGGSSTASASNNAVQTNQLQQYIDSLSFTPAGSKQLTAPVGTRQQSFTTPGALIINSVDIKFYSGESCTGSVVDSQTLNGPSAPDAGTYTSTNTSNNALCTTYVNGARSGCSGLYSDMESGNMRSMQYTYNISNGEGGSNPIQAQCMYNPTGKIHPTGTTIGVQGVANWTAPNNAAACSGSGATTCGFSQAYSVSLGSCSSGSCNIFATESLYSGNLLSAAQTAGATVTSGVAGADYLCQLSANSNESANPGTYKALIGAATRQAPSTNWPLKASYNYSFLNYDGTKSTYATNSSSIFESFGNGPAPLSFTAFANLVKQPPVTAMETYVFTGMNNNLVYAAGNTCGEWATNMCLPSVAGTYWDTATEPTFVASSIALPPMPSPVAHLYCVQQ
jgi:hypothetical protein